MNSISELSSIILTLSQLKGIGATFIKKHLDIISNNRSRWTESTTEKSIVSFLHLTNKSYSSSEINEAIVRAEDILTECESNKIGLISC